MDRDLLTIFKGAGGGGGKGGWVFGEGDGCSKMFVRWGGYPITPTLGGTMLHETIKRSSELLIILKIITFLSFVLNTNFKKIRVTLCLLLYTAF